MIIFILGLLAAWWIYSRKSEALKMVFDGTYFAYAMVLPPTVAGFFLLMIFGVNQPIGKFYECIWCSHRI